MTAKLRQDEEFVIAAVAQSTRGTWRIGENPPDAYLILGEDEIAVEITTLAQQVWADGKGMRSRYSDDAPAGNLADILNKELSSVVPNGWMVILTLRSPITQVRKVQRALSAKVLELVSSPADTKVELHILGNNIGIHVVRDETQTHKKIMALIPNRFSNPDILLNAEIILRERIQTKTNKCSKITEPVWLALFNDYHLADDETYNAAFKRLNLSHPFARIITVGRNGSVNTLYANGIL